MSFTSLKFIAFLIFTVLLYYILPKKHQWKLLLIASYIFYFFAGKWYLPYIIATTVSSYFVARLISRNLQAEKLYLAEHKDSLDKEGKKAYKAGEKSQGKQD